MERADEHGVLVADVLEVEDLGGRGVEGWVLEGRVVGGEGDCVYSAEEGEE